MPNINQNLDVFTNRLIDAVYVVCINKKLHHSDFMDLIDKIEDDALSLLYKACHSRPYVKKQFLEPVKLSEENPAEDMKGLISRLSQAVRDALTVLEFHRTNINLLKEQSAIFKSRLFDNLIKSLNSAISILLVFADVLLELDQCEDEFQMNEILEGYLESV